MGRFLPLFLSLVGTLHVVVVSGQSPAECVGRCTNEVRSKFTDMQCSDANAAPCFCKNPTFPRAILECSKSCGATMDMVTGHLTADFCKVQGLAQASGTPAASTAPASATPVPSTSAVPTTSSVAAAQTSPISSAVPTPSSTSSEIASTSTTVSSSVSSLASAETTGSPTASGASSSSSSATSETVASATSTAAAAGSASNGLSQAAIAGIGIGIGAAVIAVAGIVICMLLKGRKSKTGHHPENMEISKPLPGSGRMYPNREDNYRGGRGGSFEKYGHDIEMMTTNRYEDMVPRTQPRTMV